VEAPAPATKTEQEELAQALEELETEHQAEEKRKAER
jgi:hypothetical protein